MMNSLVRLALATCAAVVFHEIAHATTELSEEHETVWLAIDDVSLPLKQNLCSYLSKPTVRKEAVLSPNRDDPSAPDFLGATVYGTVLFDDGRFRMWYYGLHFGSEPADLKQGPICYAESKDGIHWVRPKLGQVEVKGSRDNNALKLPDDQTQAALVIKEDKYPDPQRHYKMVYNAHNGKTWVFRTATSPDGIRWTASSEYATNQFLELSSFYRHQGLYVVNGQGLTRGEGGSQQGRQGYARISTDFDHWLSEEVETFTLPEPANHSDRGATKPYDQVHLGVGGKSLGNVVVGLYGIWHNQPGDPTRKIPNAWFGYGKTSCDLGLVISNDGIHFREPVKEHVFLSRFDSPAPPVAGTSYPTILCQSGNSIVNVGDETWIYHARWRNAEYGMSYWVEIALATLPRDRWGALGLFPDQQEGAVWSAPLKLPESGCDILLNADGADGMRVEISDERFQLIPEFSGDRSGAPVAANGLDLALKWPNGDLRKLGGRTVRLRVRFKSHDESVPRLYAMYLRPMSPRSESTTPVH